MVFQPSPFAQPVGSFRQPVKPPTTDPNEGPLFYIGVNCEWMPYIAGALTQLQLQSTWDTTDDTALQLVQDRAALLIALFNCATAPTLPDLCGLMGSGGDDCMGCCLRFQDGKLQQLDCGVWTDVAGQDTNPLNPPAQPGAGSPQPAAGGGCVDYTGLLRGGGISLIPFPLSTGDTIQLIHADGATSENGTQWYCEDGSTFFAGDCLPFYGHDSSNPMPTMRTGQITVKIGSDYLPLGESGTVTIPSGHSNQNAVLTLNYHDESVVTGSLNWHISVCNNQLATYRHVFDFAINPEGWIANAPLATDLAQGLCHFAPGVGFVADCVNQGGSTNLLALEAQSRPLAGISFDTIEAVCDVDNAGDGGIYSVRIYYASDASYDAFNTPLVNGTDKHFVIANSNHRATTHLVIYFPIFEDSSGSCSTALGTLKQVIVSGQGSDPFIA